MKSISAEFNELIDEPISVQAGWKGGSLLAGLLVLALFWLLRFYPGLDLSNAQFAVLPFFLLWLFQLSRQRQFFPPVILLAALFLSAFSGWLNYSAFGAQSAVHMARLKGDEFESNSRILRTEMNNKFSRESNVRAFRYWDEVDSEQTARELIKRNKNIKVLIWGDQRWLQVSVGPAISHKLQNLSPLVLPELFADLQIVTRVSSFRISLEPRLATTVFLSKLFSGWMPLLKNDLAAPIFLSNLEIALQSATELKAHWRTAEQRAFAFWLLGTLNLQRAMDFESPDFPGYLQCAERQLRRASTLLLKQHNPELYSAIRNNFAVSLMLKKALLPARVPAGDIKQTLSAAIAARRTQISTQLGNAGADSAKMNWLLYSLNQKSFRHFKRRYWQKRIKPKRPERQLTRRMRKAQRG